MVTFQFGKTVCSKLAVTKKFRNLAHEFDFAFGLGLPRTSASSKWYDP